MPHQHACVHACRCTLRGRRHAFVLRNTKRSECSSAVTQQGTDHHLRLCTPVAAVKAVLHVYTELQETGTPEAQLVAHTGHVPQVVMAVGARFAATYCVPHVAVLHVNTVALV